MTKVPRQSVIPCLCMTCGVRNDFTHPDGYCQNGHDDWLEYADVKTKNQFFQRALQLTGLTETELEEKFRDPDNTLITIKLHSPQKRLKNMNSSLHRELL